MQTDDHGINHVLLSNNQPTPILSRLIVLFSSSSGFSNQDQFPRSLDNKGELLRGIADMIQDYNRFLTSSLQIKDIN